MADTRNPKPEQPKEPRDPRKIKAPGYPEKNPSEENPGKNIV